MISQPRYLPAINYLQRIYNSDVFVFLDTVQHSKQDYEHRNRIAAGLGSRWLSLPIDRSRGSRQPIVDLRILGLTTLQDHKEAIALEYAKAPFFSPSLLGYLYDNISGDNFVDIVHSMLVRCFNILELPSLGGACWLKASNMPVQYVRGPSYLAQLCEYVGCDKYVSGPNGRMYIGGEFSNRAISVFYHKFEYPLYSRRPLPALPWLAWIDLLFYQGQSFCREIITSEMTLDCA